MNLRPTVIAFLLCATLPLYAQSPAAAGGAPRSSGGQVTAGSQSSVPAAKIDSAKEADIRRLLDLLGTKALVEQTVEGMSKSVRPLMANSLPPGAYRERLIAGSGNPELRQEFLSRGNPWPDKVLRDTIGAKNN